jgi:hypothetical protein
MGPLLHRLGLHGANWEAYGHRGNIWRRCTVCGRRRILSFDDASEIPPEKVLPR